MVKSKEKLKNFQKQFKHRFNFMVDEPMKKHTSLGIGGPADLFAMPETELEFIDLIAYAYEYLVPLTIIGNGTNLLVSDKGIRGVVISTSRLKTKIEKNKIDNKTYRVTALSGTKLTELGNFAMDNSLTGLEFAAGIPGTLGGAVTMNAGAHGGSVSELVHSIDVVTHQGKIKKLNKNDLEFSYRHLKNRGIITRICLTLKKGEKQSIKDLFNKNLSSKRSTQPLSVKSAGCIFKNPEQGKTAGKLIDMAGLKGKRINSAVISEKHGNFFFNHGGATCNDLMELIDFTKQKVSALYSVNLKTEIIIMGEQNETEQI